MSNTITVEREQLEGLLACENTLFIKSKLEEILNPTPTMSEADWQRVVNERFYVRHVGQIEGIHRLSTDMEAARTAEEVENTAKIYEVVREKGLRQPHFKGHPHPEGEQGILVTYSNGAHGFAPARDVCWSDAREYIVL